MSVVEFIFRKAGEVLNFAKDRLHLVVLLGIWKIFRTDISCTPAASYFHYYVMSWSFLLDTSVFNLYLFRWRHRENTSEHLFSDIFQDHLLFPIFRVDANYIFLNWGYMIYSYLLYSRVSVGEVSYLLASSIQ